MTGLSRFDMYPRDWITGTRGLSLAARGLYADLLMVMYDHGGPLENDPRFLCRLLGLRDRRQLDPVMNELVRFGKIEIRDGKIHNARADREIAKAHRDIANGATGGRPKQQIEPRTAPESDLEAICDRSGGDLEASSTLFAEGDSRENQSLNKNPPSPSPSPSPSPKKPPLSPKVGDPPDKKPRKRATAIPDDWTLSDRGRRYAAERGYDTSQIRALADQFHNHWLAKGATWKDWEAVWRNWVLKDLDWHGPPDKRRRSSSSTTDALAWIDREIETMGLEAPAVTH